MSIGWFSVLAWLVAAIIVLVCGKWMVRTGYGDSKPYYVNADHLYVGVVLPSLGFCGVFLLLPILPIIVAVYYIKHKLA